MGEKEKEGEREKKKKEAVSAVGFRVEGRGMSPERLLGGSRGEHLFPGLCARVEGAHTMTFPSSGKP